MNAVSGLAHSLTTTAANASDVTQAGALLHGAETTAWGDAGYRGWRSVPSTGVAGVAMKPGRRRRGGQDAQGVSAGEGGTSVLVNEVALRLRQGALPGVGEEQAAHRVAAGVLEPADRRSLRDGMTEEQSARRWRDGGEGGVPARKSPVRSASRDKGSPRPVGNVVELQIQAAFAPRSR